MGFLVRDFIHAAPANTARKVRIGAATAFLDADDHLIAGYSYNTCLFVVAPATDYPQGRLYANLTVYGNSSSRHVSWLRGFIAPEFRNTYRDVGEPNEYGFRAWETVRPVHGHPADAIDVPRGASAADLIARCGGKSRGVDAPYHVSTTFAPPDGKLSCAYIVANRANLDADLRAHYVGRLGNAQRIDHVRQYVAWLGTPPCACATCEREYPGFGGNNAA